MSERGEGSWQPANEPGEPAETTALEAVRQLIELEADRPSFRYLGEAITANETIDHLPDKKKGRLVLAQTAVRMRMSPIPFLQDQLTAEALTKQEVSIDDLIIMDRVLQLGKIDNQSVQLAIERYFLDHEDLHPYSKLSLWSELCKTAIALRQWDEVESLIKQMQDSLETTIQSRIPADPRRRFDSYSWTARTIIAVAEAELQARPIEGAEGAGIRHLQQARQYVTPRGDGSSTYEVEGRLEAEIRVLEAQYATPSPALPLRERVGQLLWDDVERVALLAKAEAVADRNPTRFTDAAVAILEKDAMRSNRQILPIKADRVHLILGEAELAAKQFDEAHNFFQIINQHNFKVSGLTQLSLIHWQQEEADRMSKQRQAKRLARSVNEELRQTATALTDFETKVVTPLPPGTETSPESSRESSDQKEEEHH